MRTTHQIIAYVPDALQGNEGKNGARSLFELTKLKSKKTYLIKAQSSGFEVEDSFDNTTDIRARAGVGAYIIAHHGMSVSNFGTVTVDDMATHLVNFCLTLGAIEKVSLIAFNAARGVSKNNSKRPVGNSARATYEQSLLVRFCRKLAELRSYPLGARLITASSAPTPHVCSLPRRR